MQFIGDVIQLAIAVMLFDITENLQHDLLIVALWIGAKSVCVIQEMEKQEPHRILVDASFVDLMIHKCPDQVFDQILDRQDLGNLEMQIAGAATFAFQAINQEITDDVFPVIDHLQGGIKEIGQDDKIDSDIIDLCGQDLLGCLLAQDEQFAFIEDNFLPIDPVPGCPVAHVNHFNVVMCVLGEIGKTSVRTDRNQLAFFQKKLTVNFPGTTMHIDAAVNFFSTFEQLLLLWADYPQLIQ